MSPPAFADLGKQSRDLFSKGYHFGLTRLDITTKPSNAPLEFKMGATHNHTAEKIHGNLDVKYKFGEKYGGYVTVLEKWNTDNVLGTEITFQDHAAKGSKLVFDTTFAPAQGKRALRVKLEHEHEKVHANIDLHHDGVLAPVITPGLVFGHQGWLAGIQGAYNTQDNKLMAHTIALGYKQPKYTLHAFVNNGAEFGGNVYHQVDDKLEVSGNLGWRQTDNQTQFALAAQYKMDKDLTVRGKVTNTCQLGLGFTHTVKPGLKLSLSTLMNLRNVADGSQKFGGCIEFEA